MNVPDPELDLLQAIARTSHPEAERRVLGAMLRDNHAIGDVLQILREGDFSADANQRVFAAAAGLYDRGRPADALTVAEALVQRGHLADVGAGYLAELWQAAPTAANVVYYARIVRDKAVLRRLVHAAREIAREALEAAAPADDILEAAERRIFELAEMGSQGATVPLSVLLDESLERIGARIEKRQTTELPTGLVDLDRKTGGLHNGELTVLGSRPSLGKTSLAMTVLRNVAVESGVPVFFASLEQNRAELGERWLCREGEVDSLKTRRGLLSKEDQRRLTQAADSLAGAQIFVDDSPNQNMLRVAANARRLKARHGIRLVVVDYLQLVEADDRRASRHEQVGAVSRRLKQLARELDIPVVALAQLNRDLEGRADPTPRLSDLRESGGIEADADTVLLLHRRADAPGLIEVIIAKQRNGPTDTVTLTSEPQFYRFNTPVPGPDHLA